MKKKGFTLIELMIVVAIIGILAAVAIPNMAYTRKKARLSACISNLKSIASGVDMYASDNNDRYPVSGVDIVAVLSTGEGDENTEGGYLTSTELTCPVAKQSYLYAENGGDGSGDIYTIFCPAPELHYYNPKSVLEDLYFQNDVGVVEDKDSSQPATNDRPGGG